MKKILLATSFLALLITLESCKKDEDDLVKTKVKTEEPGPVMKNDIPEFFKEALEADYGKNAPSFIMIADGTSKIALPQDLDFNPTRENELWIINKGTEATGGSTVMLTKPGTPEMKFDYRKDGNAWHFMSLPSGISFSNNGNWGTSPNVKDANHQGGTFTGPALWSGNLDVYARPSGGNGSHLDMLHESPFSMGIENDRDNIFWVFDGYNQNICRYNFNLDHGPGADDHSDGQIHRYTELQVKRNPNVPSHLVLDRDKKWLYIVDGGNRRVLRMDISTGSKVKDLPVISEPVDQYWQMGSVVWEEVVSSAAGLKQPCGIELVNNRLFVSDYETGEIICYDINTKAELRRINTGKPGIMGIKIGPDKKIWFVNATTNEVFRIDPM